MKNALDLINYRLLTFDDDGHLLPPVVEGDFRSDAEAINYSRLQFPNLTVEVWCGRRLAATVDPSGDGRYELEEQSAPRSRWL